jgi:hypothetical protein
VSSFTYSFARLLDAGWSPAPNSTSMSEFDAAVASRERDGHAESQQQISWSADLSPSTSTEEAWIPGGNVKIAAVAEVLQSLAEDDAEVPVELQERFYREQNAHALRVLSSWPEYRSLLLEMLANLARVTTRQDYVVTAASRALASELLIGFVGALAQVRRDFLSKARQNVAILIRRQNMVDQDGSELESGLDDWAAVRYAVEHPVSASSAVTRMCASPESRRILSELQQRFCCLLLIDKGTQDSFSNSIALNFVTQWSHLHSQRVECREIIDLALLAGYMTMSPSLLDSEYVREYLHQPSVLVAPTSEPVPDAMWVKTRFGFDLDLACTHPAFDRAVRERIEQSEEARKLNNVLQVATLRLQLSTVNLRPTRRDDGSSAYALPHSRFELSTERTRALLMTHDRDQRT